MNRLILAALILGLLIVTSVQTTAYAQGPGSIAEQLSNAINNAITECHVPANTFVVSETTEAMSNAIIINLGLSNNYTIRVLVDLVNGAVPIRGINITVLTSNGNICYSKYWPITYTPGSYNYTVLSTKSFIEVLAYTGNTPITTTGSNSLEAYGTAIKSVVAIPTVMGQVICNTGTLAPVYIITVLNTPIMYIIPLKSPTKHVLCMYNQGASVSYLLIYVLMGIAAALLYMSVLMIIMVRRLPTPQ
jgi:hypothetical protein